jgi:membrane-bound lytic murein transglycosylase D
LIYPHSRMNDNRGEFTLSTKMSSRLCPFILALVTLGCAALRDRAARPSLLERAPAREEAVETDLPSVEYPDPLTAAETLCEEGLLAYERGDVETARQHLQKSLELLLDAEPDPETLYTLRDLYGKVSPPPVGPYPEPEIEPVAVREPELLPLEPPQAVVEQPEEVVRSNSFEVVMNEHVDRELKAYCGHLRQAFSEGLARAGLYLPTIREILEHEGLPPELAYLPLVESNFKTKARSRAGAGGLWQFMPSTGRRYGLDNDDGYVDERYDVEKSTYAAVRHLSNLYNLFNSWELALAGYNAGETTVWRAMLASYDNDFWELISNGTGSRFLRRETRMYVPKFMAAVIIAKDPEKYGFRPIVDNAPRLEKIRIKGSVDLEMIAGECGVSLTRMKDLNPELRVAYTPFREGGYELKIPAGTRAKLEVALAKMPVTKGVESFRHMVGRGETLSGIADRYNTTVRDIMLANNLRSHLIRAGKYLNIPAGVKGGGAAIPPDAERTAEELIYTVKRGDTLWGISQAFKVSLGDLKRWNAGHLRGGDGRRLKPGDKILVRVQSAPQSKPASTQTGEIKHIVKRGDNLWDISKKYRVNVQAVKQRNNLRTSRIDVGDELIIPGQ